MSSGRALIALALATSSACGYRLTARPARLRGVRLVEVRAPELTSTDEPLIVPLLRAELISELARVGLRAARRDAQAVLRTRVLSVIRRRAALAGSSLGAEELELRVECHLADEAGGTIWRSGLIEVGDAAPIRRETLAAEESRRDSLERLARSAAVRIVERLATTR